MSLVIDPYRFVVAGGGAEISDDFNRANANPVDGDWTVTTGTPIIDGNQLVRFVANSVCRHDTALSSADHWVEADITGTQGDQGILARFSASNGSTYYMGRHNSSNAYEIYRRISGTFTLIATVTEEEPALPYRLRFEVEGTALRLYANGDLKLSTTDGNISSNLHVGVRLNLSGDSVDNFEAGAL